MMRQVPGIKHLFLFNEGGSGFSWGLGYLFLFFQGTRVPQSTSGLGRPGIPFLWANFQGNSPASFADYTGGKRVVTASSVYSCITTFLVHTRGCVVNHTSVLRGQGASWAGIALKSGSWAV